MLSGPSVTGSFNVLAQSFGSRNVLVGPVVSSGSHLTDYTYCTPGNENLELLPFLLIHFFLDLQPYLLFLILSSHSLLNLAFTCQRD